jgi:hypothetical protein
MGQKEGMEREQIIACAEGREPALRDDKRRHPSASGVVDGEHQRCASLRSLPDTCLPCASPYRLPTIECLLSHPPSLFGTTRSIVAHDSRHAAFQAENG